MKKSAYLAVGLACILLPAQLALASMIAFESLPTSNSNHVSRHGVGGPVLADDFFSNVTGTVKGIEWWGAAPLSGSGTDQWEATFHFDASGVPGATPPFGGLSQHFVTATGTDLDGDGIFHYVAAWNPADMFIQAGTGYFFSIANASGSTWTWANGAAPTIGFELWDAAVSTGIGPNGGPHFGPWNTIDDANFAFRIIVAEPAIVALTGIGLLAIAFSHRRRKKVV